MVETEGVSGRSGAKGVSKQMKGKVNEPRGTVNSSKDLVVEDGGVSHYDERISEVKEK